MVDNCGKLPGKLLTSVKTIGVIHIGFTLSTGEKGLFGVEKIILTL